MYDFLEIIKRKTTSFPGFSLEVACANAHLKLPKVPFGDNDCMSFSYRATSERAEDRLRRVSDSFAHLSPTAITREIDLFHNGGLSIYSFIGMIISFSDLVSMCKIQTNSYFQSRSERLIIIHIREYINRPPFMKGVYALQAEGKIRSVRNPIISLQSWWNKWAVLLFLWRSHEKFGSSSRRTRKYPAHNNPASSYPGYLQSKKGT